MSIMQNDLYPRLLADIGGTNARFALEIAQNQIESIQVLACNNYNTIVDAVKAYLHEINNPCVKFGAFAIANPVVGDWMQMTNHHWAFSIETTRQALNLDTLLVVNDFIAQAYAITRMDSNDLVQIGGTLHDVNAPKAIIGPGTGLGVSGLMPKGNGEYMAFAGEGGHVSFSPFDDTEVMIWEYAREIYGHVSAERFLSGSGLTLIHEALSNREGIKKPKMTPEEISQRALSGKSALCRLTLDIFCAMLGTISSNLALTLGARSGVYLCGGIIPRFIDYFRTSPFRSRFEDKGRFDAYLATIPVYVVLAKYPGIRGVSVALNNYLNDKKG